MALTAGYGPSLSEMHPANNMKSENELRSAHAAVLARITQASENISFAKKARQHAVVNYGGESTAWEYWDSEVARHTDEWVGLRMELRDIKYEIYG